MAVWQECPHFRPSVFLRSAKHESTSVARGRCGRHGYRCGRSASGRPADDRSAQRHRTAQHRTHAGNRPDRGHRDRSEEHEHLVRRDGLRRPVEDDEPGDHLGIRSSTTTPSRSAAWSSIPRTRTSSGLARARTPASAARTSVTASTSRRTPARRGSASASRTPSTSERSSSTRATRTSCMSRLRVRSSRLAVTADSTRRQTAARRGPRS